MNKKSFFVLAILWPVVLWLSLKAFHFEGVTVVGSGAFNLFQPSDKLPGTPEDYHLTDMKVVQVTTDDGLVLTQWFQPPSKPDGKIVVFYHGNGDSLAGSSIIAPYLLPRGYGVFLAEYRGYSGNPGTPTEEGVYKDARAGLKWLKEQGYSNDQIVLYGHSLGSGVAVQMATEIQPKILILESTATDIAEVVKTWNPPVDVTPKDGFHTIDKIGRINASILFVHGEKDDIVPIALGRKVFDAANQPKYFHAIREGSHNDLFRYGAGDIIADWLDGQTKDNTGK